MENEPSDTQQDKDAILLEAPHPYGVPREFIEEVGESLREMTDAMTKAKNKYRLDIPAVAKCLNYQVQYRGPLLDNDELLRVHDPANVIVTLDSQDRTELNRFMFARAFGHVVLQANRFTTKGMEFRPIRVERGWKTKAGLEANTFAYAYLMPKKRLQKAIGRVGFDFFLLGGLFGLLPQMIERRCDELVLITSNSNPNEGRSENYPPATG